LIELKNRGDADSHAIGYRPDIDGLRAVAVLSVVFYHLNKGWLPGGYFGVDIFFVISGYLITSIVWREVQDGNFTIGRFYDRRIRRILPALYLLLAVTTVAAIVLLLPADLVGYGKSQLATLGFVANVYFWRDTNYFARIAETKPLLHLWSLGVEEQFYILFPPLLLVLGRYWRRGALPIVAALVVLSLAAHVFALFVDGSGPAFFLLPTRAWELGLGALPALLPRGFRLADPMPAIASTVGGALVVWSLVLPLDKIAMWPAPIVSVVGATALVAAGLNASPWLNRLLTLRPVVFVGLISYSLYLWHWPILVFSRYYLVREYAPWEVPLVLVAMGAMAVFSWRFVERPFRSRTMTLRTLLWCAGVGAALLAAIALFLIKAHGLPQRLNPQAALINEAVDTNYRCGVSDYIRVGVERGCVMNLPSRNPDDAQIVLFGNSHAQMYEPAWAGLLAKRGIPGMLLPMNGCLPLTEVNVYAACYGLAQSNTQALLALHHVRVVVLAMTWLAPPLRDRGDNIIPDPGGRRQIAALDAAIDRLHRAGKAVIVIGPYPMPGYDVATVLSRKLAFGHPIDGDPTSMSTAQFDGLYGAIVSHLAARRDIAFVAAERIQLRDGRYQYILDGHALYSDDNHLAQAEAWRYAPAFDAALTKALAMAH
jgi:peptidoglycan/LPS O-acetylase OafA/YrhL